jgi:quercetin dioxygenase-like cupin family protein
VNPGIIGGRHNGEDREMESGVIKIDKPWGYELLWAKTERYVGKILHVRAGHALSLQYHNVKDETIYLWSGKLRLETDVSGTLVAHDLAPGDRMHIAPKTVHRMIAVEDCDIFEVSTPEIDDVVRLEDRYGREDAAAGKRGD